MKLSFKFPDLSKEIRKLSALSPKINEAVEDVLLQAGETVQEDVREGVSMSNLPAQGKYSKGETMQSIVNPEVLTDGKRYYVPIGFDFSMPGAGGWLITGTPTMRPDAKLHRIFKEKQYMKKLEQDMIETIQDYIEEELAK